MSNLSETDPPNHGEIAMYRQLSAEARQELHVEAVTRLEEVLKGVVFGTRSTGFLVYGDEYNMMVYVDFSPAKDLEECDVHEWADHQGKGEICLLCWKVRQP